MSGETSARPVTVSTSTLRLMCGELDPADVRRIQAFVSIGSNRLQYAWSVISDGPPNVLLTSLDCPPTVPGDPDEPVLHVPVWPACAQHLPEGALRSPLQFDEFIAALVRAEATIGLHRRPGVRFASPAIGTDTVAAADARRPVSWAGLRFRLRRWPPANLLQQSRYGIRLASFMSARLLSLDELLHLSNVERAECERLVCTLMEHALLQLEHMGTIPSDVAPTSVASGAAPRAARLAGDLATRQPRSSLRSGLLAALRRRFGMAPGR